jgi:hypothetical protein
MGEVREANETIKGVSPRLLAAVPSKSPRKSSA